jgi:hypothetical protein
MILYDNVANLSDRLTDWATPCEVYDICNIIVNSNIKNNFTMEAVNKNEGRVEIVFGGRIYTFMIRRLFLKYHCCDNHDDDEVLSPPLLKKYGQTFYI